MPDPCAYDSKDDFISDCISERQRENPDEGTDQSFAACNGMWEDRDCSKTMNREAPHGLQHKAGEVTSVGDREAVFVASTNSPDRHGDVVEQNWDFKHFRKNPVLLFQHSSQALPIGKVERIWTEDTVTYARTKGLPEGMDDLADKVWRFIKGGFLNAVSVGFLPIEDPEPREDKEGFIRGWRFPKNQLLELSVVSVPANQEALAIARSFECTEQDIERIFVEPKGVAAGVKAAKRFAEIERLRVSI